MKRIYLLLICVILPQFLLAQVEDLSEEINKVKAPASPASIVIGNSPNTINRPKSWEALEAAIFSNYANEEGLALPNDFSLEFSPYYAQKDLKISNKEFLNPSNTITKNLSFSVSSTQNYILQDSIKSNALGFGMRTTVWSFDKNYKKGILEKYQSLEENLKKSANVAKYLDSLDPFPKDKSSLIAEVINFVHYTLDSEETELFRDWLEKEFTYVEESDPDLAKDKNIEKIDGFLDISILDSIVRQLVDEKANPKGLKVEMAAAMALDFPTNETDYSVIPKWGFWITPAYEPYKTDWLELIGVVRWFHYNQNFHKKYLPEAFTFENSLDYGVRIVFKQEKYSLEIEGVGRTGSTIVSKIVNEAGNTVVEKATEDDFQWVLNFNYYINNNLSISYNFGSQFDAIVKNKSDLISLFTLNFGIGGPKKENLNAFP